MASKPTGLFQRWLDIEKASGKTLTTILGELNTACGTSYRSNYPALMARRNYGLDRLPTPVRRHMLAVVLPVELASKDVTLTPAELRALITALT